MSKSSFKKRISGVLVAISIPIFTSQLEKAREATDLANIRSAYAMCSAAILAEAPDNDNSVTYSSDGTAAGTIAQKVVTLKQTQSGWQTAGADSDDIAGKTISKLPSSGTATVTVYGDGNWKCD